MFEVAVVLQAPITQQALRELLAARGKLDQRVLTFDDGAYVYVDLCRPSTVGESPDDALFRGTLEYGEIGEIILIGSSKSDRATLLAELLAIATSGRVVLDD